MSTFLSKLVDECITHELISADTIIVLPNQRAKKMFLGELQGREELKKPLFIPEILSIEHFVERLSFLRRGEPIELLSILYETYSPMSKKEDKLVDFLRWGDTFIKDISDLELHQQNVVSVLQDVASSKDFEFRIGQDSLSKGQKETLMFYNLLVQLYPEFNKNLFQKKVAYPGLLYRDCAEHIDQYSVGLKGKTIVFAGLFVLSPSEQEIVKYIKDNFQTYFYFDFDPFYCDFNKEPLFSTSHFLKEVCDKLSLNVDSLQFKESYYEDTPKQINLVETPGQMSQIYYAVQKLNEMKSEDPSVLENTVVVLADESMLLPFLKAYDKDQLNVTMGVPFSVTQSCRLVENLLDLYQYGCEQEEESDASIKLYHPVMADVMSNQLVWNLLPKDENIKSALEKRVAGKLAGKSVYLSMDDDFAVFLPSFSCRKSDMMSHLMSYLVKLIGVTDKQTQEYACLQKILSALNEVEQFLKTVDKSDVTIVAIRTLVIQQMNALTLSLKGNPKQGLQVMGLLETRALDFGNVIMLGVNDGIIPAPVRYSSLLPFDYKYDRASMPNYIYKDKITAYHFFRLLERASDITLLYNIISVNGLAEPSRFISQLEFEVQQRGLTNINIHKTTVNFELLKYDQQAIQVPKTEEIMNKLAGYELSCSSMQDYIRCPLRFYLKWICKLEHLEDKDNTLQTNTIGTIVHAVFQNVFMEMKKSSNYMDFWHSLKDDVVINDFVIPQLIKLIHVTEAELNSGRFLLLKEIVCKYVFAYFKHVEEELKAGDITLLSFEEKVTCEYHFKLLTEKGSVDHSVNLKGYIDRLQKKGSNLMILDYKTGIIDRKYLKVEDDSIEKVFQDSNYEKLFQLFFYAELCKLTNNEIVKNERDRGVFNPISGIISTQEALKNQDDYCLFTLDYGNDGQNFFDDELLVKFEEKFNMLLEKIFDSNVPFRQTVNDKNCEYCDFKTICHK
ncbi:MAG: PD-(D/E)XK nuclease family protein [Bacteroidales bacterium]|nr:PD-(D/E)XK nuclease family protein [Bacteroidales bacterium]